MISTTFIFAVAALAGQCAAAGVIGTAPGFAKGTTGGGSAKPAVPADIAQLKTWLTDATPRVIVLDKEYNFIGSEGTIKEKGCRPASNKCVGKGQDAINGADWCDGQPAIDVTYDKAGTSSINLGSNKSIVGVGNKGVIRGKGLRIANGAKNVIIQNIHITELNPQYIWGGDAIGLAGSDLVWIDHVKTSLIGRQHFVAHAKYNRAAVTNSEFDGTTAWSASCDNRHYWTIYFNGPNDVTFQNNYIHHTSGRSPKIVGKTLLHAVNNYFYSNSGHAFDIGAEGEVVAEGNMFYDVKTPLLASSNGKLFAPGATSSACTTDLGRNCERNSLGKSGSFVGSNTSMLPKLKGKNPVGAVGPNSNVALTAGVGKI